jgi:hypothetical protein
MLQVKDLHGRSVRGKMVAGNGEISKESPRLASQPRFSNRVVVGRASGRGWDSRYTLGYST